MYKCGLTCLGLKDHEGVEEKGVLCGYLSSSEIIQGPRHCMEHQYYGAADSLAFRIVSVML